VNVRLAFAYALYCHRLLFPLRFLNLDIMCWAADARCRTSSNRNLLSRPNSSVLPSRSTPVMKAFSPGSSATHLLQHSYGSGATHSGIAT
jgi:hypothetical protein